MKTIIYKGARYVLASAVKEVTAVDIGGKTMMPEEAEPVLRLFDLRRLTPIDRKGKLIGWGATIVVSEKRQTEVAKLKKRFEKARLILKKKPWKDAKDSRSGWDGATDTGGNFSGHDIKAVHGESGVVVECNKHYSFKTGTTTVRVVILLPSAKA